MRECFYGKSLHDIQSQIHDAGFPQIHAQNLFKAAYRNGAAAPWTDAKMPKRLRGLGANWWTTDVFQRLDPHVSRYDGTTKFLVTLADGKQIEMVLMPEKNRHTLCISSQVGCRQACTFCHTGRMGLVRNLTAAEIVAQVVAANKWIDEHPEWLAAFSTRPHLRVTNIVFMGMGEPLDNVDEVVQSLSILTSPYGLGIAQRRISVSTSGHLAGLAKLRRSFPKVPIALSLHQANDRKRSQIMPINRRWPLRELMDEIANINATSGNSVLIQYTVIDRVNDTEEDARALIDLLNGLNVKINLIPLNEVEPSRFASPSPERLTKFRDLLHQAGIRVMIRYSKGQDIAAACGQLVS